MFLPRGINSVTSSLGTEVSDLKSALSDFQSLPGVLGIFTFPKTEKKTVSGITYSFDGVSCHVTGTTESTNNYRNIVEAYDGFKGIKRLLLKFSGENVGVHMYYKVDSSDSYHQVNTTRLYSDTILTLPETATIFLVRLEAVPNVEIDETVTPIFFDLDALLPPSDLLPVVRPYLSSTDDCNDCQENGIWGINSSYPANWPYKTYGFLVSIGFGYKERLPSIWMQMAIPAGAKRFDICTRHMQKGEWQEWLPCKDADDGTLDYVKQAFSPTNGLIKSFTPYDNITCEYVDGEYVLNGTVGESQLVFFNLLNGSVPNDYIKHNRTYTLHVESTDPSNLYIEMYRYETDESGVSTSHSTTIKSSMSFFFEDSITSVIIRIRARYGAVLDNAKIKFELYESLETQFIGAYIPGDSCDDIRKSCRLFISSSSSVPSKSNFAFNGAGWLDTIESHGFIFQLAYPYSAKNQPAWRVYSSSGWSEWSPLGGGDATNIYNTYTKEITQNAFSNTYNISTTPTITTDSHGWLQSVDTNTEDENGKTDMTGAILSMLKDTGYCHLSEGIFYVTGSIDMPEGSTLVGCGKNTIIKLLDSVENGYCVRVGRRCTVRDIEFRGRYSSSNADVASEDIGGRDGIRFIANKDGTEATQPTVLPCMITNCWFSGFSGSGIYCHNTGGGTRESLFVTDCYIEFCTAGINIDYYSEYSKFTTVITYRCYYACINNGGNNVFTSCTFHGTIGWMIDNANGDKRNNAHGSVIGCTFNHIDNWNKSETLGMGDAIVIKNVTNGYIFTGCQLWYGEIRIENGRGIAFSDCLIGGKTPEITVTGNYPVFFNGCIFHQKPKLTVTPGTKFDGCYLDETGEVISA